MKKIRIGIIGVGNMGSKHALNIAAGKVKDACLAAVCDINQERLDWASRELAGDVKLFSNTADFFADAEIDAVIVATPHYDHPPLAIAGFKNNLHVLIEKPAGVYTKAVQEMNQIAASTDRIFAIMYNQRTKPVYRKLKDLIDSGELGEIKRTNWIIDWYRPQSYYDHGDWRASWQGEGGGVLLNQDPHQLDIWQWTCGLPVKIRAFSNFGKYHDIEVEDEVTAYVEYENGATGVFVTSTGIAPETNRLEITGDRGKLVVEGDKLTFRRLRVPERQFNREYKGGFGQPECWEFELPLASNRPEHLQILNNWVATILGKDSLIAPGEEGIRGLMISNAMHLSSWTDDWVELPIDEELFYEKLQEKIAASTFVKKKRGNKTMDVKGTF